MCGNSISIAVPETNIAPERWHTQKKRIIFQPSISKCKLLGLRVIIVLSSIEVPGIFQEVSKCLVDKWHFFWGYDPLTCHDHA